MKKVYAGTVLSLALLLAPQLAFAQNPCGAVCQAYYPCDYPCDLCVGDPGLWEEGGGCWGEIVSGTCGDIGQCGWEPPPICTPQWQWDEYATYQGSTPYFTWDPVCWWQGSEYVCDYDNPYRCTIYGVFRFSRHQDNCTPASSETYCLIDNSGFGQYVDHYPNTWYDWLCCIEANVWDCNTSYPQCPNM